MSTIVRSMMALVLSASAAHAQSSLPAVRSPASDQPRLVEPARKGALGYPSKQSRYDSGTSVQPVTHTDSGKPISREAPLPLRASANPQRLSRHSSNGGGQGAITTVLGSLSVVLAAFFVLVWLSRKTAPKGLSPLPGEVFESLGRTPLTARQQLQLIRIGNKLVLLSVAPTGAETLTEITDVDEVNRLAGLCQQGRSGSISETFRQVLSQYADEPAPGGFVGNPLPSQVEAANRTSRRKQRREDDGA